MLEMYRIINNILKNNEWEPFDSYTIKIKGNHRLWVANGATCFNFHHSIHKIPFLIRFPLWVSYKRSANKRLISILKEKTK